MKKNTHRAFLIIGFPLLIILVLLGIFTLVEYRPAPVEAIEFMPSHGISIENDVIQKKIINKESISIMTWNIGYASLSSDQDFFMDGGEKIQPESDAVTEKNLQGIVQTILQNPADFWLFQEIDESAKRSFNINQREYLSAQLSMGSAYAYNFNASYVPFPIPTIGKVRAGIGTYSVYELENSQRISLPVPFTWPVRTVNMKRCLLVSRLPVGFDEKEIVLVNLHLEAYDDGEGQRAQTKLLMDTLKNEYDKGNYVIAGGDFNQWFPTVDLEKYPQDETLWVPGTLTQDSLPSSDWQYVFDDASPTGRSLHGPYVEEQKENWIYYVIDGYIISPNVRVESVKTLDEGFKYSDHNPVRLEVILEN